MINIDFVKRAFKNLSTEPVGEVLQNLLFMSATELYGANSAQALIFSVRAYNVIPVDPGFRNWDEIVMDVEEALLSLGLEDASLVSDWVTECIWRGAGNPPSF